MEASLRSDVSPQAAQELIKRLPKNPAILRSCLPALPLHDLVPLAQEYLRPEAAYSDVVRLAVVKSFPSHWPNFSLPIFELLRSALNDDDEDVRIEAMAKVQASLLPSSTMALSLPATLEALHRLAYSSFPDEYLAWRSLTLIPSSTEQASRDPSLTVVLFTSEPLNLFMDLAWERAIQYDI